MIPVYKQQTCTICGKTFRIVVGSVHNKEKICTDCQTNKVWSEQKEKEGN